MAQRVITGPFTLEYGPTIINNVSEVSFDYSADSAQPTTIDGRTFDIPTTTSISATVTIIGADTEILSAIFPTKKKTLGQQMSTGETLTATPENPDPVAIDLTSVTACDSTTKFDLELTGCDTTYRLVDCSVKIDRLEIEDNVLVNVSLVFTGSPDVNPDGTVPAMLQIFPKGSLTATSP